MEYVDMPPSLAEFLADELDARGWTAIDVADRMSDKRSRFKNGMIINMMLSIDCQKLVPDDSLYAELDTAFGVSKGFFCRLIESIKADAAGRQPVFECPDRLFMPFTFKNPATR